MRHFDRFGGVFYGYKVHAAGRVVPGVLYLMPGYAELIAGDKYGVVRVRLYVDKLGDVALHVGYAFDDHFYAFPQFVHGLEGLVAEVKGVFFVVVDLFVWSG
jgi:hypothetical protein